MYRLVPKKETHLPLRPYLPVSELSDLLYNPAFLFFRSRILRNTCPTAKKKRRLLAVHDMMNTEHTEKQKQNSGGRASAGLVAGQGTIL